ncbi:MAG: urease accessory protein [Hyphomicrobiales bacterium]|nr:MAG: urease accessory protein [Hyphomicrobiales bacterium]
MISILVLGFFLGMRHALEADHVAAVASLTTRTSSWGQAVRQGAVWGLGHTLMLFVFGGAAMLMNGMIPDTMASWLEFFVGIMLVGLGLDVTLRMIRDRVHYHTHKHGHELRHFHAHSHREDGPGAPHPEQHAHGHDKGFPKRALMVGFMHGMAGSAVLIVLVMQQLQSPLAGLVYIALFGFGSVIGMAVLSMIIAVPLYRTRSLTWLHNGLQALIGVITIGIGIATMFGTYPGLGV